MSICGCIEEWHLGSGAVLDKYCCIKIKRLKGGKVFSHRVT